MKIVANSLSIDVEVTEPSQPNGQAVLLIMGLGMQRVAWPDVFVQAIAQAGYRVITHDNRDIGLSDGFEAAGVPNLGYAVLRAKLGFPLKPAYTLADMARDSLGVLDGLKIERAHVLGVSMGGMIAQRVALAAPERVLSLTSVMSTTGAKRLPRPKPEVLRMMLSKPQANDTEGLVRHYVKFFECIGSPGFPNDPTLVAERIRRGLQRAYRPTGTLRQLLAIAADQNRWRELAHLKKPTLVVHGLSDPLVPDACGKDTAARIPGARFVGIEGMGHDLPPGVCARLASECLPFWNQHDA
jgi:pimeloyl-ACP methyl ester carboxylesterase